MDNNNYNYNPYTNPAPQPKKPMKLGKILGITVAVALVFGLVAGGVGLLVLNAGNAFDTIADGTLRPGDKDDTDEPSIPVDDIGKTDTSENSSVMVMDVSGVVENAMPSIVAITNTSERIVTNMWGESYKQEGKSYGTGFIVGQENQNLYIATNNHVVADAKSLSVQFSDGTTADAEIKGTVASKDLAVVKVDLTKVSEETRAVIRVAALGDSNALKVGEAAIPIGNALGYGQSVTAGVISALGRSVKVSDPSTGATIINNNLIQTDAAINPGNSGGPLFNSKGEVIGINSVKYADTDVEGIGYAIPISDAMLVIERLINGEQIDAEQSGYLGIEGRDSGSGVFVYRVIKGSAADKAGIKAGDIITGFDGNKVSTMSQLKELLSYYHAGEEVTFYLLRVQGNEYVEAEVNVTLGDASTIQK